MDQVQILDFAMQMEKDGETFYRQCAAGTDDKGVAGILLRIADSEVKHYEVLEQIKSDPEFLIPAEATVDKGVRNLFAEMLDANTTFGGEKSELDLYQKAKGMEERSRAFYLDKAEAMTTENARDLFQRIADQEQKHVEFIESIIEFVSRAEPGNWLENSEWFHAEEY